MTVSFMHVVYGGNGTTPVDSGLPRVGEIYAVQPDGDLRWYKYDGNGVHDPSGNTGWAPNSGNTIGNGWHSFQFLCGGGDGMLYGVEPDGDLRWYKYDGNGVHDPSGNTGWAPNSGNTIGNGWHSFRFLLSKPHAGRSGVNRSALFGVEPDGDLRWYRYEGNGVHDPSGNTGWAPNSGNTIGNGWHGFRHLTNVSGVILAVEPDGDLRWYRYDGNGEHDPSGNTGWAPNSGNTIGNGWHSFRGIFGGLSDAGGVGLVIYAVESGGDLRWYKYTGNGEHDPSGNTGWHPNSGNTVGNGW